MNCIFLGSFDPPTLGHAHLISKALEVGETRIVIIPSWSNPWKPEQTWYEHRLRMCEEFVKLWDGNKVTVSDIEYQIAMETENPDFIPTIDVLRKLERPFKILITNETYAEIERWKDGDKVLEENEFLVFNIDRFGKHIGEGHWMTDLNISSTMVRELLRKGIECPEYLSESVYKYIKNEIPYYNRPSE